MDWRSFRFRDGNHTEAYQIFADMLKKFDRDDLVKLWDLVKERFNTTEPTDDKEKELYMHDPLVWRLYDTCGVCWVLEDFTTYCCWFNIGAASEDLVLLRKIEENRLNHNLWDIIVDGDLQEEAALAGEQSSPPAPKTAKQLTAKRNQERVKSILLLAIPDEYLLKFHNVPDAKSL
ncbi:hypothetical protein Tco_0541159 [Tanacetum coccineum]